MELQKLETFRENDYGHQCFFLATSPPITLSINYDLIATQAYRFTSRCLWELEHSEESLNNGLDQLPAISMWFQSIHSFLNSLLQLNCLKRGENFEQLNQYSLEVKYNHLLSQFGIVLTGKEHVLQEMLSDFSSFELASRRSFINEEQKKYHKAKFSGRPMQLNQADVLQCMVIAVEVFQSFRFTIAGLDLMPCISIQVTDHVVFDRLDLLFRSVIIPSVRDILAKQKLTLDLEFETDMDSYPVNGLFTERDVLVIGKVIEDNHYKRQGGMENTNIMGYFFDQFAMKFYGNEQRFGRNYLAPGFDPFKKDKI